MKNYIEKFSHFALGVAAVLVLLIVGRGVLIPIAIAAALSYLLIIITDEIKEIKIFGHKLNKYLAGMLSIFGLSALIYVATQIVQGSINTLIRNLPSYEANFLNLLKDLDLRWGLGLTERVSDFLSTFPLESFIGNLAGSLTTTTGKVILIIVYTVFMMIEYRSLRSKIAHLVTNNTQRAKVKKVAAKIEKDINTYLKVKTFASLLTAVLAYIILALFGVDLAIFWALLIFILNYIPSIGSIIATSFPAALTLVQFGSLGTFFLVTILLVFIQLLVGNGIEPRIAGQTLSISPLFIILGLVVCGAIWGVVGMFLAVPIIIITKIFAEQVPGLKPLAVILSYKRKHDH